MRLLLSFFLVILLLGCSMEEDPAFIAVTQERPPAPPIEDTGLHTYFKNPVMAKRMQDSMLERPVVPFDALYVAEIEVEGAQMTVTSLSPRILNKVGELSHETATSVVRFNDDLDELIFFTRNPVTGTGFRAILPLESVADTPTFSFPIIVKDKIKPTQIKIVRLTKRPPLVNELRQYRYRGTF